MSQKISNCGHDENGKYSGGSAGDQTGTEWYIRTWYSYPWNYAFYHADSSVNALVAQLATEAAENDKIGYDQSQRETFWTQLKSVGYYPRKITTKCEADCSAGVAAIVKAAGYILGNAKLQSVASSAYTGNLKTYLVNAGYTCYSSHLTDPDYYPAGTIWLNAGNHTTIQTTTGSKYSGSTSSGSSTLDVDGYWGTKTTLRLQNVLGAPYKDGEISRQNPAHKSKMPACTSGWEWNLGDESGSQTIKLVQKKVGATQDGIMGPDTINAMIKYYMASSGATVCDGKLDEESLTVKAMQRALNNGSF